MTELLAKAVAQDKLDDPVSKEDKQVLLAALRQWGALDANYRYAKNDATSDRRGFARDPGGGLSGEPVPSDPIGLGDIVKSRLWARMQTGNIYEFHSTIFQPVGASRRPPDNPDTKGERSRPRSPEGRHYGRRAATSMCDVADINDGSDSTARAA